jgi:hypothetical protein
MTITASGRSLLILAAGLWLGIAGPMRATESDARPADASAQADSATDQPIAPTKVAKPRHSRKVAAKTHKSDKVAVKTETKHAEAGSDNVDDKPIADAVANANAQLPPDAAAETPQSISAKADSVLKGIASTANNAPAPSADPNPQADPNQQLVAADQLNDVDRAVSDEKPALTLASATIDAPVVVSPSESSSLDQTSLIGKIFIAFGGLLTLASAARMFIA